LVQKNAEWLCPHRHWSDRGKKDPNGARLFWDGTRTIFERQRADFGFRVFSAVVALVFLGTERGAFVRAAVVYCRFWEDFAFHSFIVCLYLHQPSENSSVVVLLGVKLRERDFFRVPLLLLMQHTFVSLCFGGLFCVPRRNAGRQSCHNNTICFFAPIHPIFLRHNVL
jgi:hypothetical protein